MDEKIGRQIIFNKRRQFSTLDKTKQIKLKPVNHKKSLNNYFFDIESDSDDQFDNFTGLNTVDSIISSLSGDDFESFRDGLYNLIKDDYPNIESFIGSEIINVIQENGKMTPDEILLNTFYSLQSKLMDEEFTMGVFSLLRSELMGYLKSTAFEDMFAYVTKKEMNNGLRRVVNYYAACKTYEEVNARGINCSCLNEFIESPGVKQVYSEFLDILNNYFVDISHKIMNNSRLLSFFEKDKTSVMTTEEGSILFSDASINHKLLSKDYSVVAKVYDLMNKYQI